MREIFSIILIGVALSMDTFSLSLSVGMFNTPNKKALELSIIVGLFHFIMPFLGMLLGEKIVQIFELKSDILLGFVLILIAIEMIIDLIRHEENKFNLTFLGMILFAVGVSIDSFSLGIGLKAIVTNKILAMSIFSCCSFLFTFLGVIVGRYASKILGVYANIIGIIILFILGLIHLI